MPLPHKNTMYVIVTKSQFLSLTKQQRQAILDLSCEKSIENVRLNNSKDKGILKFKRGVWKDIGIRPAQLDVILDHITIMTRDEIIVELRKPEWISIDNQDFESTSSEEDDSGIE